MIPVPGSPCIATIRVLPGGAVWIRLIGVVEPGAEPALHEVVERVRGLSRGPVILDVAGVTYAGGLFVQFLLRLHDAAPGAPISLRHARSAVRVLVTATGIDEFVTFDDLELPPPGRSS